MSQQETYDGLVFRFLWRHHICADDVRGQTGVPSKPYFEIRQLFRAALTDAAAEQRVAPEIPATLLLLHESLCFYTRAFLRRALSDAALSRQPRRPGPSVSFLYIQVGLTGNGKISGSSSSAVAVKLCMSLYLIVLRFKTFQMKN